MTDGRRPTTDNAQSALLAVWVAALGVAILAASGVDVEGGLWEVVRWAATAVAVVAFVMWLVGRSRER